MLKIDMHVKIKQDLSIDLHQKEQELNPFSGSSDATTGDETDPLLKTALVQLLP